MIHALWGTSVLSLEERKNVRFMATIVMATMIVCARRIQKDHFSDRVNSTIRRIPNKLMEKLYYWFLRGTVCQYPEQTLFALARTARAHYWSISSWNCTPTISYGKTPPTHVVGNYCKDHYHCGLSTRDEVHVNFDFARTYDTIKPDVKLTLQNWRRRVHRDFTFLVEMCLRGSPHKDRGGKLSKAR